MTQATARELVKAASSAERGRRRRRVGRRGAEAPASPVSEATRQHDPLANIGPGRVKKLGWAAALILAALAAHALAVGVFFGVGVLFPPSTYEGARSSEKVEVRVLEPEPLVEPPEPVAKEPEVEQATEPESAPEPEPKPQPRPEPKVKKRLLAADPIDEPKEPIVEPKEPRRRVVGLSLESTVSGADGPSFAVGNTRMGRTAGRAEDPSSVEKAQAVAGERRGGTASEPNKAAARLPLGKVDFEKPRRLAEVDLEYPPLLKARGVEGNVMVLIRISAEGRVESAKVLRSSGHEELDRAARAAALRERFVPAKRDGEPVAYTLKYTYRFRIKDA